MVHKGERCVGERVLKVWGAGRVPRAHSSLNTLRMQLGLAAAAVWAFSNWVIYAPEKCMQNAHTQFAHT